MEAFNADYTDKLFAQRMKNRTPPTPKGCKHAKMQT
jgi:hypothetical protein